MIGVPFPISSVVINLEYFFKVSTACGVNFIQDKEYLIYDKIDGNNLQTTTCDGSWFLDGRNDDDKILKNMGATHSFIDAREIKHSS